jgi:NTP pyrophosphatase (non-canonical NTP hydrolase)
MTMLDEHSALFHAPLRPISLTEYQTLAAGTAVYPGKGGWVGLSYCALKLNGEAGECAEKVGKMWRDDDFKMTKERRQALIMELGDVLWYVSQLAAELNVDLNQVAQLNIEKLARRKVENKLKGDGDDR